MRKIMFKGSMLVPDDANFFEMLIRLGIKIKQLGNNVAPSKDDSELEISVEDAKLTELASPAKPQAPVPPQPV